MRHGDPDLGTPSAVQNSKAQSLAALSIKTHLLSEPDYCLLSAFILSIIVKREHLGSEGAFVLHG